MFLLPITEELESKFAIALGAIFGAVGNKYFIASELSGVQVFTKADFVSNFIILMVVVNMLIMILQTSDKTFFDYLQKPKNAMYFSSLIFFFLLGPFCHGILVPGGYQEATRTVLRFAGVFRRPLIRIYHNYSWKIWGRAIRKLGASPARQGSREKPQHSLAPVGGGAMLGKATVKELEKFIGKYKVSAPHSPGSHPKIPSAGKEWTK